MVVDVVALSLIVAVSWGIYSLSPGREPEKVVRVTTGHGLDVPRPSGLPWPKARRFLLARVLRVPARHLASVSREEGLYLPACVCGWSGDRHRHPGAAFSEAHVHTQYLRTVIDEPT